MYIYDILHRFCLYEALTFIINLKDIFSKKKKKKQSRGLTSPPPRGGDDSKDVNVGKVFWGPVCHSSYQSRWESLLNLEALHNSPQKCCHIAWEPHLVCCTLMMCVCVSVSRFSHVRPFVTPWTVAHQAPLYMKILQARILESVAMSSSRGFSQPRDWTHISCISCIAGRFFYHWPTKEAHADYIYIYNFPLPVLFPVHFYCACK